MTRRRGRHRPALGREARPGPCGKKEEGRRWNCNAVMRFWASSRKPPPKLSGRPTRPRSNFSTRTGSPMIRTSAGWPKSASRRSTRPTPSCSPAGIRINMIVPRPKPRRRKRRRAVLPGRQRRPRIPRQRPPAANAPPCLTICKPWVSALPQASQERSKTCGKISCPRGVETPPGRWGMNAEGPRPVHAARAGAWAAAAGEEGDGGAAGAVECNGKKQCGPLGKDNRRQYGKCCESTRKRAALIGGPFCLPEAIPPYRACSFW